MTASKIPRPRTLLGYVMVVLALLAGLVVLLYALVGLFGPDRPWCLIEAAWQYFTAGASGSCA